MKCLYIFLVFASLREILTVGNTVFMPSVSTPRDGLPTLLQTCYIYLHKETLIKTRGLGWLS
jgi:hypothetical protein